MNDDTQRGRGYYAAPQDGAPGEKAQQRGYYTTRRNGYVSTTKVVSVKLPVALITALDELISRGYFQNRSDAIREAIRRLLSDYRDYSSGMLDKRFFIGYR